MLAKVTLQWDPHPADPRAGGCLVPLGPQGPSGCQVTGPLAVTRGRQRGGGGRASLFPLCRELLYKGSGDIIH